MRGGKDHVPREAADNVDPEPPRNVLDHNLAPVTNQVAIVICHIHRETEEKTDCSIESLVLNQSDTLISSGMVEVLAVPMTVGCAHDRSR